MIKTHINESALTAAVTMLFGEQANDVMQKTYQALDAAMHQGFLEGVEEGAERFSQDDWDNGYDAGFTAGGEAERLSGHCVTDGSDVWDAGYDAGYEECERQNGITTGVPEEAFDDDFSDIDGNVYHPYANIPLFVELRKFLYTVGCMEQSDADDLAETFMDHWTATYG